MSEKQQGLICSKCQVTFTAKRSLNTHLKKFHGQVIPSATNYECGLCHAKLPASMNAFHNHIQVIHTDVSLNFLSRTFYSDEEFNQWKLEMEKSTQAQYTQKSGAKRVQDERSVQYFHCHRSGKVKLTGTYKRNPKRGGSIKSGVTCPAYIKVSRTEIDAAIEICIVYQSTHVGHDMEVRKMHLTREERTRLAVMLRQGIPKSNILSNLQAEFSPHTRISRTNRKDLFNIEREFKINRESMLDSQNHHETPVKVVAKNSVEPLIFNESFTRQKNLSEMVAREISETTIDEMKAKTVKQMEHILGFLQQSTCAETVQFIHKTIKTIEMYISKKNKELSLPSTSRGIAAAPANMKIEPQPRQPEESKKKKAKTCQGTF